MDLLLATRNAHKTLEIQRILGPEFAVHDLAAHPEIPEIDETGKSFRENAILKATAVSSHVSGFVIGDDSGLEVDALSGEPGIYSARYAGKNATDRQNIDKLLGELVRTETRGDRKSARFRCVVAVMQDSKLQDTFEGVVEGTIVDLPRGEGGFGYDPVFQPDGFEQTFGELPAEIKDRISHRGKAVKQLANFLRSYRGGGGGGGAPGGAPGA